MSYRSETIATAVRKLNESYFLPAIQREFVWKPPQIVQLFDSILRGYPISSFLFWELTAENRDKWQAYRFLQEASDAGTHNEVANTDGVASLSLILDGQQRLTSLNIGLRGYYKARRKHGRWDNPDAWSRQKLYLNLLHDSKTEDEQGEEGIYFGLAFLVPTAAVWQDGAAWFEIGRILAVHNEEEFGTLKEDLVDELPGDPTREQMRVVRLNLDRLYNAIHRDQVISYYLEEEQDYDRVLDIFVRANAGGTKLAKSDLMMSTITASWGELNAREEIHGFVDHLNWRLSRNNDLDKDFVMKSCLVLTDLPIRYRVQNFNHANLMKIKEQWPQIKRSLKATVEFVNRSGIDRDNLTSANALIPIAYYLHHRPLMDLQGSSRSDVQNAVAIKRWLFSALITGAFGGSSDTALSEIRNVLRTTSDAIDFPADQITKALLKSGRAAKPEDVIDAIDYIYYGRKTTFLLLSLLYPDQPWGTTPHHIDHIFPKALFEWSNLMKHELTSLVYLKDRVGNLCLLIDHENLEKQDLPFDEWIKTRDSSFLQRHLIPTDPALWKLEKFAEFSKAREDLIEDRIREILIAPVEEELTLVEVDA